MHQSSIPRPSSDGQVVKYDVYGNKGLPLFVSKKNFVPDIDLCGGFFSFFFFFDANKDLFIARISVQKLCYVRPEGLGY